MDFSLIKDVSVLLNAMGIGNCFLLSCVYLRSKSDKTEGDTKLLSFLFFSMGIIILNTILNLTGYNKSLHGFEPISNALSFAVAPLLYLYVKSCANKIKTAQILVHLGHFYLYLLFMVGIMAFPSSNFGLEGTKILSSGAILLVWNLHFFSYLLVTYSLLKTPSVGYNLRTRVIFWSIASIWVLNLLLHVYRNFFDELPTVLYLNITLLFTALTVWVSFKKLSPSRSGQRWKEPKMRNHKDSRRVAWNNQIFSAIESNKYYRDPDLSIRKLSDQLDMPYTQLSTMINQGYNQNFNEFINGFRVREVIDYLQSGEHRTYTIMALAQKAGFRSRSVFYTAFKKEKGTTPKEFLQSVSFG